jgi:hypothetical protein
MGRELTVRETASRRGRATPKLYIERQRQAWRSMGGRPPKLTEQDWARLFYMLRAGKTQADCAREFKITTRTIGRALVKARAKLRRRSSSVR